MTYTYAVLEVSQAAYTEVRALLHAAGYQHAFHQDEGREVIDMHGIALASGRDSDASAAEGRIASLLDLALRDADHPALLDWVALMFERRAMLRLQAGVREHRDARGDDRCWRDDETLYALLPEGYTPPARDTAVELRHCERFIASRQHPATEYVSPQREIERLEAELVSYRTLHDRLSVAVACSSPDGSVEAGMIEDLIAENARLRDRVAAGADPDGTQG